MLTSHMLGPLFIEYEASLRQMDRALQAKNQELARMLEEQRMLVKENEEMS
jgi:hypothetical protein